MAKLSFILISSMCLSAPSVAAPKKVDAAEADKRICRTHNEIGSRVTKERICLTRSQWKELAQLHSKGMGEALQKTFHGKIGQ